MRNKLSLKIDENIDAIFTDLAAAENIAKNKYIELWMFRHCQAAGRIPLTEEPPADGRGGWQGGGK